MRIEKSHFISSIIVLIISTMLMACSQEKEQSDTQSIPSIDETPSPTPSPTPGDNSSETEPEGPDFAGLDSITDITDSSATLNWSHSSDIRVYQIFRINGSQPVYLASVDAPANHFNLADLSLNTEYTYWVRAFNLEGQIDSNTKYLSFRTTARPKAPTSITLSNPLTSPGFSNTPTLLIGGVKAGDTISVFTNSNCTTGVGSEIATDDTVEVTTDELTPGSYTFYAQAYNESASTCSTASVVYTITTCPTGYVLVPADPSLGVTNGFCVMQYEAKAWTDLNADGFIDIAEIDEDGCAEASCITQNWATIPTYKPVSRAEGLPWRRISQTQAKSACAALNAPGTTNYALINNSEWMTLAHNIENQNDNWTGGTVGNGMLFNGNTGANTAGSYNGSDPEGGIGRNNKAMHVLSNGNEIWDVAGNVWDWIDWTISPSKKAYSSTDGSALNAWRELSSINTLVAVTDPMAPITWQGLNSSYGALQGYGHYYAGTNTSGGSARRGGAWAHGQSAGLYSLDLFYSTTSTNGSLGFRCVYHP